MVKIFRSNSYLSLKDKKTILFIMYTNDDSYTNSYGIYKLFFKELSKQFNCITIDIKGISTCNKFVIDKKFFNSLKRKKDSENYINENINSIFTELDKVFKNVKIDYIFNCSEYTLPLTTYTSENSLLRLRANEFYDYTEITEKDKLDLDILNKKVNDNFYRYCSLIAYSSWQDALGFLLQDYFANENNKVFNVVIDPANSYTYHFKYKPNLLYFANDYRGSRKFNAFDIAQFQLTYMNIKNINIEKTKTFIWYGTLFYTKGNKKIIYEKFLKNIKHDIDFFCPVKLNGLYTTHDGIKTDTKLKESDMYDLSLEVSNDKNYKGYIEPKNLVYKLSEYKYGLISACVSLSDSLNMRPVFYTFLDVLPFFDDNYDPSYLLIPKDIQDKLRVKSSEDIDKLIDYYDSHETERIEMLNKLKKLLRYEDYVDNTEITIKNEIKKLIPEFDTEYIETDDNEW